MTSTGSLEASDQAAAEVQKTPNRVTLEALTAKIGAEYFFTAEQAILGASVGADRPTPPIVPALKILTICVITTQNGFVLLGKSAPADPGNFNAEVGCKFAREDAMRQLWQLEGYLLREKLHQEGR